MPLEIKTDQIINQNSIIEKILKQATIIFFDDFYKLNQKYSDRNQDYPEEVWIPKSDDILLSDDPKALEPYKIIKLKDYEDKLKYKGIPIWKNPSKDTLSLAGTGLINGDKSKIDNHTLFGTAPHAFMGGATGHGKSVTLNSILINAVLEHGPWNLQLYLVDPKVVEMATYINQPKILPHVNTVAATPDVNYTFSLLEYAEKKMRTRNEILEKYGVRNTTEFHEKTNLTMPMMVIVVDEVANLITSAGRKKSYIDEKINQLATLGRNTGVRLIMASQSVVKDLKPETWSNILTRMALGCTAKDSEAAIGNKGANKNFKKMGRLAINTNASGADEKENTYTFVPFLPSNPIKEQKSIHEIMHYLSDIGKEIGFDQPDEVASFVLSAELFERDFLKLLKGKPRLDRVYIGEPSSINKTGFKLGAISLLKSSKLASAEGKNILIMTEELSMLYNLLNILLENFVEIQNNIDIKINLISPTVQIIDIIRNINPHLNFNKINETADFNEAIKTNVTLIKIMKFLVSTDYRLFNQENQEVDISKFQNIYDNTIKYGGDISDVNIKRLKFWINDICTKTGATVLGLELPRKYTKKGDPVNDQEAAIVSRLLSVLSVIDSYTTVNTNKQLNEESFKKSITILPSIEMFNGFDKGKSNSRNIEDILNTLNQGPIYGTYIVATAQKFDNQMSEVNKGFKYIMSYYLSTRAQNSMKISDNYPEPNKNLFVFSDLTTAEKLSTSYKYPKFKALKE